MLVSKYLLGYLALIQFVKWHYVTLLDSFLDFSDGHTFEQPGFIANIYNTTDTTMDSLIVE